MTISILSHIVAYIAPYLVGLLLGYILHMRVKLRFYGYKNLICRGAMWGLSTWIFASYVHTMYHTVQILFGLYGTWYGHKMSPLENIMFYTFTHFAWGIDVAMVIFSCVNGHGWIITDFFSMKIWVPLSHLTYGVSLVHPFIIEIILGSARQVPMYEDRTLIQFQLLFSPTQQLEY